MIEKKEELIAFINSNAAKLQNNEAVIGFDGFVDSIVRVVRDKNSDDSYIYFKDISEFGQYLIDRKGKSFCIEMHQRQLKMGGNMPITANALGKIGVKVNCLGAMGESDVNSVFKGMNDNCTIYSLADPGYTTALEFADGKVMLAHMESLGRLTWKNIKNQIGIEKIIDLFSRCSLIGMLNWSETLNCSLLWEGILRDVMPNCGHKKDQIMFFDLSDCSKHSREDLLHALELISEFSRYCRVMLSLNSNESEILAKVFELDIDCGIDITGKMLFDKLSVEVLVIHTAKASIAWDKSGKHAAHSKYIDDPVLLTGGGDNFNAGLCTGLLMGMDIDLALALGNCVGCYYVKNGESPDLEKLVQFIESL